MSLYRGNRTPESDKLATLVSMVCAHISGLKFHVPPLLKAPTQTDHSGLVLTVQVGLSTSDLSFAELCL